MNCKQRLRPAAVGKEDTEASPALVTLPEKVGKSRAELTQAFGESGIYLLESGATDFQVIKRTKCSLGT